MNDDIIYPIIFLALFGLLFAALIVVFNASNKHHAASMACIDRGGYYIREAGICIPAGVEVAK